jgi:hypothetical protein
MKKTVQGVSVLLLLVICTLAATAQEIAPNVIAQRITALRNQESFQQKFLFTRGNAQQLNRQVVRDGSILQLDKQALAALYQAAPASLELQIPYKNGSSLKLTLGKVKLLSDDFSVTTSESNGAPVPVAKGIFYQGIVNDDPQSLAAISIFGDDITGITSNGALGDIAIGKYPEGGTGSYIAYSSRDVIAQPFNGNFCGTRDIPFSQQELEALHHYQQHGANQRAGDCVRLYLEADFATYQNNGSNVTNTTNFVTALMNGVNIIYANERINTVVSAISVNTTLVSYSTNDITAVGQFRTNRPTFTGDFAQLLISNTALSGIASGFGGPCSSNLHSLSRITNTNSVFPTYSWNLYVVAHEFGHTFGSRHTHACVWNGNFTQIDGCSGFAEGNCGVAGVPAAGGGTIMSYCHQVVGVGIGLANGFGLQPGDVIRSRIASATCLQASCSQGTCALPGTPVVSSITSTSAAVSWTAAAGATNYRVEYRQTSAAAFTSVTVSGTSTTLTGLIPNNAYEVRVKANCGTAAFSNFTAVTAFSTLVPALTCTSTAFEPNESIAAAAAIGFDTDTRAAITTTTDQDYFRFTVPPHIVGRAFVSLSNIPAGTNYNLTLFNGFSQQIGSSSNAGTANESILINNITPGTYYVRVNSAAGSSSSCYTVRVSFNPICAEQYEPNNSAAAATPLTVPFRIGAQIPTTADQDWYGFTIGTTGAYSIVLRNQSQGLGLELRNSAGTIVASVAAGNFVPESIINLASLAAGSYTVRVFSPIGTFSTTSCYILEVRAGSQSARGSGDITSTRQAAASLQVAPNPASSRATVTITLPEAGNYSLSLVNQQGAVVKQLSQYGAAGTHNVDLLLEGLPAGVYSLRLLNRESLLTEKLVIQ